MGAKSAKINGHEQKMGKEEISSPYPKQRLNLK